MARLLHFLGDPEQQARAVEQWALQSQREGASTAGAIRVAYDLLKRKETRIAGGLLFFAALFACTRPASSGVIPTEEASDTPGPSDTPTGTTKPTGIDTATAAWTETHGSVATEPLVVPPSDSLTEDAPTLPDIDGDGLPDFPDIDPNNDGVDGKEMASGVQAVAEWVNDSLRVLADGKSVSPMIEKLAHLFGFDQEGIRAELAAAPDQPPIDLPWIADTDVGRTDITTVAEHLYSGNGVGILTTGEGLDNLLKVLVPHARIAGQLLDDPDSAVMSLADLRLSLANSLGVDSDPRAGIQPSPLGELGRNGDLCLNVTFGEGSGQNQSSLNIPVVVDAEVQPGSEFMDSTQKIHVSNKSAVGLALGVVNNSELAALQRFLRDHGDVATVTRLSPSYSLVTEAFLLENNPEIEGSQLFSCGRPAQGGAHAAASPTQSATPSATETLRPQGGGQPPATEVPQPQDTHIPPTNTPVVPSATPTPRPTDALPPTNTPVGPPATEAPFPSSTPFTLPTPTEAPPAPTDTAIPPTAEPTEVPVTIIPPDKTLPFDTPIPPTVQTPPTPLR